MMSTTARPTIFARARQTLLGLLVIAGATVCTARTVNIDAHYAERIADAIYLAEGGHKAKVPFGIISVRVRGYKEARRVCLNTIKNTWLRWHQAGRRGDFIDFLGNRYCPPSVDPKGNIYWRRNVRYFLKLWSRRDSGT